MIRQSPEISAGSMADIAFLLLIFFLVTTTMDIDSGIARKLPPLPTGEIPPVKKRNILEILINKSDRLLVAGKECDLHTLKMKTKEFYLNPTNAGMLSEKKDKFIEALGKIQVSKGIVSLKSDRGTSYEMYIQVQDQITAAFHELRNALSKKHYEIAYDDLKDPIKIKAIRSAIPLAISEAEPENTAGP